MNAPECEPQIDPERYLSDVLAWRPPLPVGVCDISDIRSKAEALELFTAGYAWERLPRWLAEVEGTYKKTRGKPIVCVDICSSLPLYSQLLRASEFARSGRRGHDIESEFFGGDALQQLRAERPEKPELVRLASTLARNKYGRSLLASFIQETLYTLTEGEADNSEPALAKFKAKLADQLSRQKRCYVQETATGDVESAWLLRYSLSEGDLNYYELLASLPVPTEAAIAAGVRLREDYANTDDRELAKQTKPAGDELAMEYIDWQASRIAGHIVGNERYRPARFFSLDSSRPEDIAMSSVVNTPRTTQSMNLFTHAVDSLFDARQHIVADVLEPLPVPDDSLTLITSFDGWPFHFKPEDYSAEGLQRFAERAVAILMGFYDKLTYGGKLVIFPWAIADSDVMTSTVLNSVVVEFARQIHHGVDLRVFHGETLDDWMSESDKENSIGKSPIFQANNDSYAALVVEKPHETLVKKNKRAIIGQLAIGF